MLRRARLLARELGSNADFGICQRLMLELGIWERHAHLNEASRHAAGRVTVAAHIRVHLWTQQVAETSCSCAAYRRPHKRTIKRGHRVA